MKDLRFLHAENKVEVPEAKKAMVQKFREAGEDFNRKHKHLTENKAEYEKFRKKSKPNTWNCLKNNFLELCDLRCPICENQLNKYDDIDHYRPKSHYWWLAYNYKNYMLYCDLCNRMYKKEQFPLFVENNVSYEEKHRTSFENRDQTDKEQTLIFNPAFDNPKELFHLEFRLPTERAGIAKVQPNKNLATGSFAYHKATETISLFNLNNTATNISETDRMQRQSNMENNFNEVKNLATLKEYLNKAPKKEKKLYYIKYQNEKKRLMQMTGKSGLIALIDTGNFTITAKFI